MSWRSLSARGLWASSVHSLAAAVPVGVVVARVLSGLGWRPAGVVPAGVGAALLTVAAVLVHDALRLRATRWRLTGDRLELRSGIAVRQHRSVPRDRVRSVDLRADPVRRVLGLTVVRVGTGEHAGGQTELTLDPLTRRDGEELRRALLPLVPDAAGNGHGDGVLAELRWSWIRYAPLSVWAFTGGALVLGALYKPLDALGVEAFSEETLRAVWQWVSGRPWVTVPLVVAGNVAVGVLGAGLLFAESWARYRLAREPGRLRLSRGLLTSRSLTLEERRLRGVEIREPLLLRLGGGARVTAVATGLGKAEEGETEDVAALTPPLPHAEAARLAARIAALTPTTVTPAAPARAAVTPTALTPTALTPTALTPTAVTPTAVAPTAPAPAIPTGTAPTSTTLAPGVLAPAVPLGASGESRPEAPGGAGGGAWAAVPEPVGHPRAARRRRLVRAVAAVAALAAACGGWVLWAGRQGWDAWAGGWVWLVPALALPAALWLAVDSYRGLGHALGRRHLVTRHGSVTRRTVVLDRAGIVGWTIKQSYVQRRAGLLTVTATTAAGAGHYDVPDVDHDDGLRLAARAVPGLLEPFLVPAADGDRPGR
ncbi:PH domain-containing protein [Nonomuraea indica]|uniref:PH domain-containing protein n=1 Tax=Nonomuraea indica TaxID=1581193 RepID=A0ABW8A616_9ACTN